MTIPAPSPPARDPLGWLNNQPYLLLSLTSLFWAGNIVLGRYVAGHVPPITLSCIRWIGALSILLPFARPHLKRDWPRYARILGRSWCCRPSALPSTTRCPTWRCRF